MTAWRPYEQCRENEFRAWLEREPGLKWVMQWVPYLVWFVPLGLLRNAGEHQQREALAYHATDIAR